MSLEQRFWEIVEFILSKLNNKTNFASRLEIVTLEISEGSYTWGKLLKTKQDFTVKLNVKSSDPLEYAWFVTAHEIYHLLFESDNILNISDSCQSDCSYALTSIVRVDESGQTYGEGLQDMICDYLAIQTIHELYDIPVKRLTGMMRKKMLRPRGEYELTEELINLFSDKRFSIEDQLDDIEGNEASNLFMYTIVTGCMATFITSYDSYMGDGWWKKLCESFEAYFMLKNDRNPLKFIKLEFERFQQMQK